MSVLDEKGVSHFWGIIKALINTKAEQEHTHSEYLTEDTVKEMFKDFAEEYLDNYKLKVVPSEEYQGGQEGVITIVKPRLSREE